MPIIVNKYLLGRRFSGMVLWPFIVLKRKELRDDKIFMNHEKIHWQQQKELLVLPFYLWYLIEYAIRLIQYKNRHDAYMNISFEREAYDNECDLSYPKKRNLWSFLKYLNTSRRKK